jgi:hypothetical protein
MKMRFPALFIVLAWMAGSPVYASTLDFQTVDRLTYHCYIEQKWDSVIVVGKQALKQDIDYYYLRVRMGVASFEIHEYFPAITHLQKARQFNSGDPFVTDYLYRAYLNANRTAEARILMASSPESISSGTEDHAGFVDKVHFEGGYTFSSNTSPGNLATLMGENPGDTLYGEQDLYGDNLYGNLSVKLNLSKRVNLSLAYTYLNFAKQKYFQHREKEDHLEKIADSAWGKYYVYTFPFVTHDTSFKYNVNQHEICLSAGIQLPEGFSIFPAFHLLHVGSTQIRATRHLSLATDTGWYQSYDSSYHTFEFLRTRYSYELKDTSFTNYLVSLMVAKDLGIFNLALSGSWSNLNGSTQAQAGFGLTYYPLGNLNFYGTTTITGFFQKKDNRLLLSQVLGVKAAPWCWAEGNFYYGDYTNANIFNGSVVYNNSDKIDYRAGINVYFAINRHFQLSLIYQYMQKQSQQYYYEQTSEGASPVLKTQNNPYHINSIIGGITWKL